MKKKTILLFFALACISFASLGQRIISPVIAKGFPPSIVKRIYLTVVSKMNLSEQGQLWLANAYIKQDSVIAHVILTGEDSLKIIRITDSTEWLIADEFKTTLSTKEKLDYENYVESKRVLPYPVFKGNVYMDENMDSQFGIAFKTKNALQLSDSQCINILKGAHELKAKQDFYSANPDSGFFDHAAFENDYLSKVLTEKQYNDMLANKNAAQCRLLARYVWHDLKIAGLDSKFNKDSTLNKVAIYYMLKAHINDRLANEKERRNAMLGALKLPDAIKALQEVQTANKQKLNKYSW